jgi:hypothetical protein
MAMMDPLPLRSFGISEREAEIRFEKLQAVVQQKAERVVGSPRLPAV